MMSEKRLQEALHSLQLEDFDRAESLLKQSCSFDPFASQQRVHEYLLACLALVSRMIQSQRYPEATHLFLDIVPKLHYNPHAITHFFTAISPYKTMDEILAVYDTIQYCLMAIVIAKYFKLSGQIESSLTYVNKSLTMLPTLWNDQNENICYQILSQGIQCYLDPLEGRQVLENFLNKRGLV